MFSSRKTAAPSGGYNLTKSLRFRSSASAYLNRTPSASNRQTWTWSAWIKRGVFQYEGMFSCYTGSGSVDNSYLEISFNADKLQVSGYSTVYRQTSQVFRDPSAWYHIVVALDTTQATGSNRLKIYVNGTQVTAFATSNDPTQNSNLGINQAALHSIANNSYFTNYYDGEFAEINFIDGQALSATSFGSTNSLTGVWQPAKYTGTYGTNGFYLPFTNTTSTTTLGYDFSGNSNNWTTNNISLTAGATYDSMNDVPTLTSATTANYCVLNPISYVSAGSTITDGNLKAVTQSSNSSTVASTIGMSSGKYYSEFTFSSIPSGGTTVGIMPTSVTSTGFELGSTATSYSYLNNGQKYNNGSSSAYGASYTTSDVIGVAFDATNGTLAFYKNGTSQGTAFTGISGEFIFAAGDSAGAASATFTANFGQQPFSYTPPTGYVALNTYNLPTSTIVQGNKAMDATLYTGNATTNNITSLGFQPDFSWFKVRSEAGNHIAHDVLRGTGGVNRLYPNLTNAESTNGDGFVTFTSNGFNLDGGGGGGDVNGMTGGVGRTYVAWSWKANGAGSSNTSGSITSTVSVNASAGFSIVTYASTTGTVGHGLGVAPAMIIMKATNLSDQWTVGHQSLNGGSSPWNYGIPLNDTAATQTNGGFWNNTAPTSSVFSQGSWDSGYNKVAYCWTPIPGFSSFGSYTGNGSSDGTFVYTGFSPSFVMVKRTDTTGNWFIVDDKRLGYNGGTKNLYPNLSNAEATLELDLISNGFKWRLSGADVNASGGTYIYMAFAENPFKNALAR